MRYDQARIRVHKSTVHAFTIKSASAMIFIYVLCYNVYDQ